VDALALFTSIMIGGEEDGVNNESGTPFSIFVLRFNVSLPLLQQHLLARART